MKAVVLAGGVRSGLEIPGSGLPRALWPFPHAPLISRVLQFLKNHGCGEMAICANGKTRMIAAELSSGNSPWLDIHYSEDSFPRGPAGCLRDLQQWLGDESFVVIQGTGDYAFDLQKMAADHAANGAAVTVGARPCDDAPAQFEPAGVYIIHPKTLPLIPTQGYHDLKEQFLPKVLAAGHQIRCHKLEGRATLIHSPTHYLNALESVIRECAADLPAGYVSHAEGVIIHESARVHPTARLRGDVWIAANAVIEEHAVVAGPTLVAANAIVEKHALVHNAVVMTNARVKVAAEAVTSVIPPGGSVSALPAYEITISQQAIANAARARKVAKLGGIRNLLTRVGDTLRTR